MVDELENEVRDDGSGSSDITALDNFMGKLCSKRGDDEWTDFPFPSFEELTGWCENNVIGEREL